MKAYLLNVLKHPDTLRAFLLALVALLALVIPVLPVDVIISAITTGVALLAVAVVGSRPSK